MKINLIKLSIISLLFSVVFSLNIAYAVPTNTVQTGNTTNATNTTATNSSTTAGNSTTYNTSTQIENNTTLNNNSIDSNSTNNLTNNTTNSSLTTNNTYNNTNNNVYNNSYNSSYNNSIYTNSYSYNSYDYYNSYEETDDSTNKANNDFDLGSLIIKSLVFAVILATVLCGIIWLKHKPVHLAKDANKYLDTKTLNITNSYDHYIRSETKKTAINQNNR